MRGIIGSKGLAVAAAAGAVAGIVLAAMIIAGWGPAAGSGGLPWLLGSLLLLLVIAFWAGRRSGARTDAPLAELQSGGASLEEIFARTTAREVAVPADVAEEARP